MTVRTRLWKCPSCGERFTTANQWHSCGKYELAELLDGCAVSTVELFDQFSGLVHTLGPVRVIPQKDARCVSDPYALRSNHSAQALPARPPGAGTASTGAVLYARPRVFTEKCRARVSHRQTGRFHTAVS